MAKFFLIALSVILIMHIYVSWHVWRLLPCSLPIKLIVLLCILAAFASMILQFRSNSLPLGLATAIYEIGNSWLIILFYLMMAFLVLDLGRLFHLVPAVWLKDNAVTALTLSGLMLTIFIAGNIHYHHKERQEVHLMTDKSLRYPIKIVLLSDLHVGYHNRRAEVGRWVNMINAEQADLILIAGDMIDGKMRPLLAQGTAEEFSRFNAPTLMCLGNHEYIAGIDKVTDFIQQTGINLLRDKAVTISNVTIVGRDDRSNRSRKNLEQLMHSVPHENFIILLDHQPFNLEEAEQNEVDLQLSGHTHHGQVWPLNLVTKMIYECDYGLWERGKTNYYVSSGIGIWGGKFRIGTSSEYVVITVTPVTHSEH